MIIYQWSFYYFMGNSGYGTRKTKNGPLFSSLQEAKDNLDLIKIQYSTTFNVGFICEFNLDELCYGNVIYKTKHDYIIDHEDCHNYDFHKNIQR